MKVLVTGGGGQLASELERITNRHEVVCLTERELDIRFCENINNELKKYCPDVIVNTAAYTAVDRAEEEKGLARSVNSEAVGILAGCCANFDVPMIHVSTDYVFDGRADRPYREDNAVNPINVYGDSKLKGEILLQERMERYIILRVSSVFGFNGVNFIKTILRLAKEREDLSVVDDQFICPTWAKDIADVILKIVDQLSDDNYGVYHYSSLDPISWYSFALEIFNTYRKYRHDLKVKNVNAISSDQFNSLANRPKSSVLDCSKIHDVFGVEQKTWRIGLKNVIQELCNEK